MCQLTCLLFLARYTNVGLAQTLAQKDLKVFGRSYVAKCSSVDGIAAFLDVPADHRHVELFQRLSIFSESGQPCFSAAQEEAALEKNVEVLEQRALMARLETEGYTYRLRRARRDSATLRRHLKKVALQELQSRFVRERREWKIYT